MAVAAGVVPDAEGAEALSGDGVLAAALDEVGRLRAENAELRVSLAEVLARDAGTRAAEMERPRADFAVLQRMLFGRSSEKSRPEPPAGDGGGDAAGDGGQRGGGRGSGKGVKRGPGAQAGRRDYSHLPRFEVFWDFPGGGCCCPQCGEPFTLLGDHWSGEQLDWQVIVRLVAHCRRRYRRACSCRVPATVMAPGPPKAIGKGLFTNAFTAMLLTERFVAGRSMNSLVTGLERQGAGISPATLAGTCAQAGGLLAPLADAITARSRGSWHLHADETTWRVLGGGFPGLALPFVPGQEVAGVVEAAGDGAGARPGERVYASLFPAGGGFAERALASADRLAPMPGRASFAEAAGLVIGGGTAYEAPVDRGRLRAGQTVLITAAAESVRDFVRGVIESSVSAGHSGWP